MAPELIQRARTDQGKITVDLGPQKTNRVPYPPLAMHRRRIQEGPSDENHPRAKGDCLQHVAAAPKSAVDQDWHVTCRRNGPWKRVEHSDRTVQLPPTMVGDHHAIGSVRPRE